MPIWEGRLYPGDTVVLDGEPPVEIIMGDRPASGAVLRIEYPAGRRVTVLALWCTVPPGQQERFLRNRRRREQKRKGR